MLETPDSRQREQKDDKFACLTENHFAVSGKSGGRARIVVVLGFLVAYQFVEPAPPRTLTIGTGDQSGAYHRFGERYRHVLAREDVDLRPSSGAVDNLANLLADTDPVDVAFIQGGVAGAPPPEGLEALGSMFLEPLWVFVRNDLRHSRLNELEGLRLAIELIRPGPSDINDINNDEGATHLFRCRFDDQLNAELQLRFQGCFFEILNIVALDPPQTFQEIRARVTGEASKEASLS